MPSFFVRPGIKNFSKSSLSAWAVVVAQLVERSLPKPEVVGSNPVIGKLSYGPLDFPFLQKQ